MTGLAVPKSSRKLASISADDFRGVLGRQYECLLLRERDAKVATTDIYLRIRSGCGQG